MNINNPVWPDTMADPAALKVGNRYYAYGTGPHSKTDGRAFRVLGSHDFAHWQEVGGALTPLADPAKKFYWAPEVAERDGTFFMYYSAGGPAGEGHQLRLATATKPEGPFTDTGRVLLPSEPFSIDGHPFRDPKDGRWYLYFAKDFLDGDRPGTGTAVVPLGDDMAPTKEKPRTAVRATADWQIFERSREWLGKTWPAWHTVEGPFVVFHDGRYYLFYSGGRWESDTYGVGYAVADHPLGPWKDEQAKNGATILRTLPGKIIGPGHNSVVKGPDGKDYIVYHAWDTGHTARRMFISPLEWTASGPRVPGYERG